MSQSPKTIILSAPQGAGKTARAGELMRQHGCIGVVQEFAPGQRLLPGFVHTTNVPPEELQGLQAEVVSFGWTPQHAQAAAQGAAQCA